MKVLFVTPWVPNDLRPRSLGLMQLLAGEHEVRLLSLVRSKAERDSGTDLGVFHPQYVVNQPWRSVARCASALITGTSLQTAYADVPEWRARLREVVSQWSPDVVHLNVFRSAHLVRECGTASTLIDLDEFRSDYYAQLGESGRLHLRLLGRLEHPRMALHERRLISQGVSLVLCSPPPLRYAGSTRIHVVRTPVADPGPRPAPASSGGPTALFVGRLTYEANVHSILRFVRSTWPQVRTRMPDARLQIVGSGPPRSVRRWDGKAGIEVYGDVPCVIPYYAAATVSVVPMLRATGVQMKLIQALAAGVPTIASPTVADLAGVSTGGRVVVAPSDAAWVRAIEEISLNRELRESLISNGRRWYEDNHSPAAVAGQLRAAYEAATGLRSPNAV